MEKLGSLRLEDQICFPLYACSREIIKAYRPHLDRLGLTYTQYITMAVLWEAKQVSVKELGKKLHLDSGTLTPLLKKLERKGYLKRERSRQDERVVIVCITEDGQKLKQQAEGVPQAMLAQMSAFSQSDAKELYRLLYQLMDFLEKLNGDESQK
ncbi:MarR family winged helix-turn-helix transcriptional regulator [Selenomonas ruminis]|uniref:MarR family transcriptional regulator n=1 Tax=Selenomonas ruminis TaxID=2593411 RepID=A0A5D6VXX7_9FIRM|nr:MarR family transcriptional regulator [Selenomonas sp. mPRGC5]TYZ20961.1 MarR family transcriptional regulator [Selenomonas sp. mPRGC5]